MKENQAVNVLELSALNALCGASVVFEREVSTKRSKRVGETQDEYKLVKPIRQTLCVDFNGVNVLHVFDKAISSLAVTYQNGLARPMCDKLDERAKWSGDSWETWLRENPRYTLKPFVSSRSRGLFIEEKLATMSAEQLASSLSIEQLAAALEAARAKQR